MTNKKMNAYASHIILGSLSKISLTHKEKKLIERFSVPGITLFARNLTHSSASKLSAFIKEIQSTRNSADPPYLIAVDQEGGRVSRLKNLNCPDLGASLHLEKGNCNPASLTNIENYAKSLGDFLKKIGINVNFAPVTDILTEKKNNSIGDRAFSHDPPKTTLRSGAFLRGLHRSGIYGCLKHFPGQGDACFDTHLQKVTISVSEQKLKNRELLPYYNLRNQSQMIMLSHCIYPTFCSYEASRSAAIITGLLKKDLGYQGLILTDDLTMGAAYTCEKDWGEFLVDSIAAGSDLLLICKEISLWQKGIEIISKKAQSSPFLSKRIFESAQKIHKLRKKINNSK